MKKNKFAVILLNLIVALANFWIWRALKIDLLLGSALLLVSVLASYLIFVRYSTKIMLFTFFIVLLISFRILGPGFDKNLTNLSIDQEKQLGERHGYFAVDLGRFFQNRFALRFYKDFYPYINNYTSNIFNSLSPNLYFFGNHPREREKIEEISLYPSVFIIPFLMGLTYFLRSIQPFIIWYLLYIIFVTGFIEQNFILGPILFFPLINLFITGGFLKFTRSLSKNEF